MNSAQYIKKSRIFEHEAAMASVTSKNVSYTMASPRKTGPGKGALKEMSKKKVTGKQAPSRAEYRDCEQPGKVDIGQYGQ